MSEDGFSGVVAIWNYSTHLYAQRVDSSGVVLWNITGVPVCTTMNTNNYQEVIGDEIGGAIATWYGSPINGDNHIYAQKVYADGTPGVAGSPITGTVLPKQYYRCSPNPFAFSMNIQYSLNEPQDISLNVYNIAGQSIKTLFNARQDAGMYTFWWNGQNDQGRKVSNGVYVICLKTPNKKQIIKATRIK